MVKRHKWTNGVLETFNHHFSSFIEAHSFANSLNSEDTDVAKIYDENGQLVHETKPSTVDTYA